MQKLESLNDIYPEIMPRQFASQNQRERVGDSIIILLSVIENSPELLEELKQTRLQFGEQPVVTHCTVEWHNDMRFSNLHVVFVVRRMCDTTWWAVNDEYKAMTPDNTPLFLLTVIDEDPISGFVLSLSKLLYLSHPRKLRIDPTLPGLRIEQFTISPEFTLKKFSCAYCGTARQTMQRCTGCKVELYCDRKCQDGHWRRGHKGECASMGAFVKAQSLPSSETDYYHN